MSHSEVTIKGFTRVQIKDKKTRKIVGDSGWHQNVITDYGYESCIVASPIGAGSVQAAVLMLGSGGVPTSTTDAIPNSNSKYISSFAQSSVIGSSTARMTVSFDGTLAAATLSNIGVYATSNGSLIAGNSYASSALATDQDVNCTYEFRYAAG